MLSSLSVALGTSKSTFSAAVDKTGRIYVEGSVKNGTPYLEKIGGFDVELAMQGSVLLCRQRDQPGIVGSVGMALAKGDINISFMTVCRTSRNEEAIMAIGIDDEPSADVSMRAIFFFSAVVARLFSRCCQAGSGAPRQSELQLQSINCAAHLDAVCCMPSCAVPSAFMPSSIADGCRRLCTVQLG